MSAVCELELLSKAMGVLVCCCSVCHSELWSLNVITVCELESTVDELGPCCAITGDLGSCSVSCGVSTSEIRSHGVSTGELVSCWVIAGELESHVVTTDEL